jgi:hypothetical protein
MKPPAPVTTTRSFFDIDRPFQGERALVDDRASRHSYATAELLWVGPPLTIPTRTLI